MKKYENAGLSFGIFIVKKFSGGFVFVFGKCSFYLSLLYFHIFWRFIESFYFLSF